MAQHVQVRGGDQRRPCYRARTFTGASRRGLASDKAKDVDIANLPHDPWLSYDVWLVNSDAGK
jgi:hypothetical protein